MSKCAHHNVAGSSNGQHIRFWCYQCGRWVKPTGFVLAEQPLANELALMDFAARVPREAKG